MRFDKFLSDTIKSDAQQINPSSGIEHRLMYAMSIKSSQNPVRQNSLIPEWLTAIFTSSAMVSKITAVTVFVLLALSYHQFPSQNKSQSPVDSTMQHLIADSIWHTTTIQWTDSTIR